MKVGTWLILEEATCRRRRCCNRSLNIALTDWALKGLLWIDRMWSWQYRRNGTRWTMQSSQIRLKRCLERRMASLILKVARRGRKLNWSPLSVYRNAKVRLTRENSGKDGLGRKCNMWRELLLATREASRVELESIRRTCNTTPAGFNGRLEDDALVVSLAMPLRLDAVSADGSFLAAFDTALSAGQASRFGPLAQSGVGGRGRAGSQSARRRGLWFNHAMRLRSTSIDSHPQQRWNFRHKTPLKLTSSGV
jgi:hypothetical protein